MLTKPGDVVWIYPAQYVLAGSPKGFAFQVNTVLGAADPQEWGEGRILVRGLYWQRDDDRFSPYEIELVISAAQPLAVPRGHHRGQVAVQPEPDEPPERLVVGTRRYVRARW